MSQIIIKQLNNLAFLLGHTGQDDNEAVVLDAIKHIKKLEADLKSKKESIKLLEQASIRKSVRRYNEHKEG